MHTFIFFINNVCTYFILTSILLQDQYELKISPLHSPLEALFPHFKSAICHIPFTFTKPPGYLLKEKFAS